ncbi:hypothetical protein NDU88_005617 [Pleurodeles waltl]|uniref:Uncharacterized protein n=1 Tax=Pleurodeles waltl TaxID=8319 RepID=A0AAV7UIN2_PLEWA|nr:hypothetical protein NDU88_005617 [Pleurodeles waltl]
MYGGSLLFFAGEKFGSGRRSAVRLVHPCRTPPPPLGRSAARRSPSPQVPTVSAAPPLWAMHPLPLSRGPRSRRCPSSVLRHSVSSPSPGEPALGPRLLFLTVPLLRPSRPGYYFFQELAPGVALGPASLRARPTHRPLGPYYLCREPNVFSRISLVCPLLFSLCCCVLASQ